MKVPARYLDTLDDNVLVIVATRQTAALHHLVGDRLEILARIDIPTPTYSDREGFFARSGRGMRLGSGSVYEFKKRHIQEEFLRQFRPAVADAVSKTGTRTIYLYAPAHRMQEIEDAFPYRTRRLISRRFRGNFSKLPVLELLERAAERRRHRVAAAEKQLAPASAKRIMKKAKKARKVTGA
jgi:hypothetical protein